MELYKQLQYWCYEQVAFPFVSSNFALHATQSRKSAAISWHSLRRYSLPSSSPIPKHYVRHYHRTCRTVHQTIQFPVSGVQWSHLRPLSSISSLSLVWRLFPIERFPKKQLLGSTHRNVNYIYASILALAWMMILIECNLHEGCMDVVRPPETTSSVEGGANSFEKPSPMTYGLSRSYWGCSCHALGFLSSSSTLLERILYFEVRFPHEWVAGMHPRSKN